MQLNKSQVESILKNAPAGSDKSKILDGLITRGYELEGVDTAQAKASIAEKNKPQQGVISEAGGDIAGIFKDIGKSSQKRAENIQTTIQSDTSLPEKALQVTGQLAGAGADAIGNVAKGVANTFLSDKTEKDITDVISKFGAKVVAIPEVQGIINKYNSLPENEQRNLDAVGGIVSLVSEFVGGNIAKRGADVVTTTARQSIDTGLNVAKNTVSTVKTGVKNTAEAILPSSEITQGVAQKAKELLQRVPRGLKNMKESTLEASKRAKILKTSTPEIKNAINSQLDDVILNTVKAADKETVRGYKKIVDIAENPSGKLMKERPEIIAGEAAAKQYDLIDAKRNAVGKKIGEIANTLSKNKNINISNPINEIDSVMVDNGIIREVFDDGVEFNFSNSSLTTAERSKIKELYTLATEAGTNVSANDILQKNRLFSKLQREAKFEGIGDIFVNTPDGNKSIFSVFKDIYSNKLLEISPEIKLLNKDYAGLTSLTDDIENSLIKSGKFKTTRGVDSSKYIKTNLRRALSDATSAADYQEIINNMDSVSRTLGYKGARADDLIAFATEMRKLYPDSIPITSLTGINKATIGGVLEKVLDAGAPSNTDKQKALKALLEKLAK